MHENLMRIRICLAWFLPSHCDFIWIYHMQTIFSEFHLYNEVFQLCCLCAVSVRFDMQFSWLCVNVSKDTNRLDTNYDSFHIHWNVWHCQLVNTICRRQIALPPHCTVCLLFGIVFNGAWKMSDTTNQVTEHQYWPINMLQWHCFQNRLMIIIQSLHSLDYIIKSISRFWECELTACFKWFAFCEVAGFISQMSISSILNRNNLWEWWHKMCFEASLEFHSLVK